MSNGRLKLTQYGPETLVGTSDVLDAVASGLVDIVHTNAGYTAGKLPKSLGTLMWCFPFSLEMTEEWQYLCWQTRWRDILVEQYAKLDVHLVDLGPWPSEIGEYGAMLSTRPVYSTDDFKGLKVRSFGYFAKMYTALGAESVSLPIGEAYTALATGTIEALTYGGAAELYALQVHEIAKYFIDPSPGLITCLTVLANADSFNALPDDLKAIVDAAVRAVVAETPSWRQYNNTVAAQKLKDEGVTFIKLSATDRAKMKEIMWQMIEADAAEDPVTTEAVQVMKDYMKLFGYE